MKKIGLILMMLTMPLMAGRMFYAPDLAAMDDRDAWLGVVNNSGEALTVTVHGYTADGQQVGEALWELAVGERVEVAADSLFDQQPAWAALESDFPLVGYVRYQKGDAISMVPLTRFAGPDLYLPGITEDGTGSQVALVNTSADAGEALSSPWRRYPHDFNANHLQEPSTLEGFGAAKTQLRAAYDDLVTGEKKGLRWDRIQSALPLVGVHHFHDEESGAYGSLVPALTPLREMIIAPLAPAKRGYRTHFVVANTTDQPLQADLTIRDLFIAEPLVEILTLEAGEKRVYTFGDPTQLPQFKPIWFHIRANENGLVGYQYTEARNGGSRAYWEAKGEPGSRVVMPYVRHDAGYTTRFTLINPTDETAAYTLSAYGADGSFIKLWRAPIFLAGQAEHYTLDEVFGDQASDIAWFEVRALRGKATVMGLIHTSNGSTMAAITGTPTSFSKDARKVADYEFLRALELGPQGWTAQMFDDEFARPLFTETGRLNNGEETPDDGSFFLERNFGAGHGKAYFGYEPRLAAKDNVFISQQEEVALVSPYFEVPDYANCYVSFDMRLINPEFATAHSRYGIAWRTEGSDDWHWFGLTGEMLLDPNPLIADCWERVCYRSHDNEVTLTPWFPFQAPLPETVAGKRIQVGLFYHHVHTRSSSYVGPTLFVDNIGLTATGNDRAFYYEDAAGTVWPDTVDAVATEPEEEQ